MTSADRRARQRAQVRELILDAARDLFARQGFESVTLRGIAEAIEYAPAAIYGHFRDKEQLVRALCLRDWDELTAEFARLLSITDPLERIAMAGRVFVRFATANPNHFRVLFLQHQTLPEDEDMRARKGDPARDGYAFLRQAVALAIEQGRLRPELRDADLVAQTFWAGVQGVASIEIAFHDDPWVDFRSLEARTETIVGGLMRGFAAPGAWKPPRGARTSTRRRKAARR